MSITSTCGIMKVAKAYDFDDIKIETIPIPTPGPHEALVQVKCCGICSGDVNPWYVRRKCPTVLGHEPAGKIVEVGSKVSKFKPGDRVFVHHHAPCGTCRHCTRNNPSMCSAWRASKLHPGGLAEYMVVPQLNLQNDTLLLPDHLTFEEGALVEPIACVVRAFKRAQIQPGDKVAVIGLGFIGQVMVILARYYGASLVLASDKVPYRLQKGLQHGASYVVNIEQESFADAIAHHTKGEGVDLVLCGPSNPDIMSQAIQYCAKGGRVLYFMGPQPGSFLKIDAHQIFFNEIDLLCSYSCGPTETQEALNLISSGVFRDAELITHRFPLEETAQACRLTAQARNSLKVMVHIS